MAGLAVVLVVACIILGLEIYHLHNQVNGLQNQVNSVATAIYKALQSQSK